MLPSLAQKATYTLHPKSSPYAMAKAAKSRSMLHPHPTLLMDG
jgi:hypothetical protein